MLPPDNRMLQMIAAAERAKRHRRRDVRLMALRKPKRAPGPVRVVNNVRYTVMHELTDYPCMLPDGTMGKTAIGWDGEEWMPFCVRA